MYITNKFSESIISMTHQTPCYPISLVGSGTGDPELLTVKALKVIGTADVLLYDCREAEPATRFAPHFAKVIFVNRRVRDSEPATIGFTSVLELMKKYYSAGCRVVRLKTGDPMLFGGETDECLALQQMNIPFEVIPGITAGVSIASNYALPISAKYQSNSVTYLIADDIRDNFALVRDAAKLLKHGSTIVLYMAKYHIEEIFRIFEEEGISETIPVVAVSKSGWPDEAYAEAAMKDIVAVMVLRQLNEPVTYLIGHHLAVRTVPSDRTSGSAE